jgi:hypothetical protein
MKWILSIAIFVLTWFSFPDYQYFPTQNSAYHHSFAQDYKSGKFDSREILTLSDFQGHFVDQHVVFHFLLIPFLHIPTEPWLQLKVAQVFFSGLLLVLIFNVLATHVGYVWALLGCLAFLGSNDALKRFWMLRVDSVALLFFTVHILYSNFLIRKKKWFLWALSFSLCSMVSWVNLTLLACPLFDNSISKQEKAKFVLLGVLIISLQLFLVAGEGFGFNYFLTLMKQNFLSSNIDEWKASAFDLFKWGHILVGLVIIVGHRFFRKTGNRSELSSSLIFFTLLFTFLALRHQRFYTISVLLFSVLFAFEFGLFLRDRLASNKWITLSIGAAITVSLVAQLMMTRQTGSWGIRSNTTDLRGLARWIEKTGFQLPKRVINERWESWSEMLFFFPYLISEPGLAPNIYSNLNSGMNCLSYLRYRSKENQSGDFFNYCVSLVFEKFDSDLLLGHSNSNFIRNLKKMRGAFKIIYSDRYVSLLEKRFFLKSETNLSNLKNIESVNWLKPAQLLKGGFLTSIDNYGKPVGDTSASRFRAMFSAVNFCDLSLMSNSDCLKVVKWGDNLNIEKQALPFLSFLDLLKKRVKVKEFPPSNDLFYRYLNLILPSGQFLELDYTKRDMFFYPGEILLYILKDSRASAHKDKIESALRYYSSQFIWSRNQFMIRWLSEVLLKYRQLFGDLQFDGVFQVISQEVKNNLLFVCGDYSGADIYRPGLWLEGLGLAPDYLVSQELKLALFRCAVESVSKAKHLSKEIYFYGSQRGSSFLHIDTHAHSSSGYHIYKNGRWIE